MPNNWQMVDTNFPTITDDEPVKEQVAKIIDYLAILTEQLQYQLQNLDSSNWNANALNELTDEASSRFGRVLANLQSRVDSLSSRINSAEGILGRMRQAEENIGLLEQDAAEKTVLLDEMTEQLGTAQADIDELQLLLHAIEVKDDVVTIGGEGKTVRINGTVYINGVLHGQQTEEEVT